MLKHYYSLINFLSFSNDLRKLRRTINHSIDLPIVIEEFPDSHPRGFIKEFKRRRTTIVETYLRITKSLESANYKERINALNLLAEHIIYSRSLKMPLNAARVQLALMKKVVQARDNKRKQLELMQDFTLTSFGHPRTIRKFLKKLDIIEVPETGKELKDLNMGWDFHVHDSTSYGRKEPTQLIIDAFIKGMSELTVTHNNLNAEDAVKESLEAGRILGIKVNIALEFSALTNGKRFHYMYILPNFSSQKKRFKKFLKQKSDDFKEFLHELEENEKKRKVAINELIKYFNKHFLPQINQGFEKGSIYYLQALAIESKEEEQKLVSRRQLGEFLYPKYKKVLARRALKITSVKNKIDENPDNISESQKNEINRNYLKIRKEYYELSAERLRMQYFSHTEKIKVETAVSSLEDISKLAQKTGASIKFIQPLEHGLQDAVAMILENYQHLSRTEIFNMYDSIDTDVSQFVLFTQFIKMLNQGNVEGIVQFCETNSLKIDSKKIIKAADFTKKNKFLPSLGSDATGRSTLAPGMGFIFESRIEKKQLKYYKKEHFVLPKEISQFIYEDRIIPNDPVLANSKNAKTTDNIICLGKIDSEVGNRLGDEKNRNRISLAQAWEYINPALRNLIFILIGFLPAYFTVGAGYALLWFTITGTRNIFVDLISGNGFSPKEWNASDIDWTNVANSLFWTGFSIPILNFVKSQFDVLWTWEHIGGLYEFTKFFFINTANGMYLASHNYIRGFDKATIRANFFRSILAWPMAAAFSPLGNALLLPSIVQAKFWSDFVAAIIEGSGKYRNILQIKSRVMKSLMPELYEAGEARKLAILDLLYFTSESTRAKIVLQQIMNMNKSSYNFINKIFDKKQDTIVENDYYNKMLEWFSDSYSYSRLCDFVIENYNNEQSIYLLGLVSKNYDKFHSWLKKMK